MADLIVEESSSRLLTPEQADLLQVSTRTMYEWLRRGEIPSVKFGNRLVRVRERDVLTPDVRLLFEQGMQLVHSPNTVEQAARFFEKAIRLNPRYTLPHFELGRMYYAWGHYHKAIEPLKKAIELNPEAVASHINLGMNYNHAGIYRDAEEVLRQALEIVPRSNSGTLRSRFRADATRAEQRGNQTLSRSREE
ncbi:MAG TPA: tetratricopeptide repeat protein [Pyrinomonadaceae bacterium]|nr:tetratricopeptide repeat protein [Pyrinomonadaceae bacterium]